MRHAANRRLEAVRVDSPEAVRPAWEKALAHDGPVLYEAVTDPNMPPPPPQTRFETARNVTRAFLRGDPAARDIVRHAIRARRADLGSR